MAEKFEYDLDGRYQDTETYASSSSERRRQYNKYKREFNISDEHMFLLLFQQDLLLVPEDVRKKGDTATSAILVLGFLLLWSSLQSAMNSSQGANVPLIFLSVGSFSLVAIVYFTGLLNPYKRAVRTVDRRLKKMPEVPDFFEWSAQNPVMPHAQNKTKKRKKRR